MCALIAAPSIPRGDLGDIEDLSAARGWLHEAARSTIRKIPMGMRIHQVSVRRWTPSIDRLGFSHQLFDSFQEHGPGGLQDFGLVALFDFDLVLPGPITKVGDIGAV